MNLGKFVRKESFFWIILIILVGLYGLLAFKDPFSDRSLVPNLEPYPDTLLYTLPAWNWTKGLGFRMMVGNTTVRHTVPMTYSYFLAPFMKVTNDVRGFYYGNILLGIITIIIFLFWLRSLLSESRYKNPLVLFLGFLLVTNFYFFNEPVLPMAENLNFPLICLFFYWQTKKLTFKNFLFSVVLIILTVSVKMTNLVISGLFGVILTTRLLFEVLWPRKEWRKLAVVVGIAGVVIGTTFFLPKIMQFNDVSFNLKYFTNNWAFYWNSLKGGPTRNLWYFQKTVTVDIFVLALLGLVLGITNKKYRFGVISWWVTLVIFVAAMSVFRDTEGRHVMVFIPVLIASIGICLDIILRYLGKFWIFLLTILLILNLSLVYEPTGKFVKLISLKQQIGLNLRHKEIPWNYVCVTEFNQFFNRKNENAYFGSFLPMYLYYFYGNDNYHYLPLSYNQDFMERGLNKYFRSPLKAEYLYWLNQGKNVYYSDYYSTNGREAWKDQLTEITKGLIVTKVFQSPEDACNVYQLSLVKK